MERLMRFLLLGVSLCACIAALDPLPEPSAELALNGSQELDMLLQQSRMSVADLSQIAQQHDSMRVRGEAILSLAQRSGRAADEALATIQDSTEEPLVQAWAAAARVQRARDSDSLMALVPMVAELPALGRPIQTKLRELSDGSITVSAGLILLDSDPSLQAFLLPMMMEQSNRDVVEAMLTHSTITGRQTAAGMLATMAQQDASVGADVAERMAFQPGSQAVPWQGGPLYIPSVGYSHNDARAIIIALASWHLHCDRSGDAEAMQQINNNLRSVGLLRRAGIRRLPHRTDQLLTSVGQQLGSATLRDILHEHGLEQDSTYTRILASVENR
jgi:hypothetical protein